MSYLVLAHRQPALLARLVARLWHPDDEIVVHVDRKVAQEPFRAALADLPGNVALAHERFVCHWGGTGVLHATVSSMRAFAARPGPTHLVVMTGQDYPIKPLATLRALLAGDPDATYLSWSAGDPGSSRTDPGESRRWVWGGELDRLVRRHYLVLPPWSALTTRRFVSLPQPYVPFIGTKQIPAGLTPYHGGAYFSMARAAVECCLEVLDARPRLLPWFSRVLAPDEFVFQMLLLNSALADTVVNDDLYFIRWKGWHPEVLTDRDLPALLASPALLARKCDATQSASLLDALDARVHGL